MDYPGEWDGVGGWLGGYPGKWDMVREEWQEFLGGIPG